MNGWERNIYISKVHGLTWKLTGKSTLVQWQPQPSLKLSFRAMVNGLVLSVSLVCSCARGVKQLESPSQNSLAKATNKINVYLQ